MFCDTVVPRIVRDVDQAESEPQTKLTHDKTVDDLIYCHHNARDNLYNKTRIPWELGQH